MHCLLLFLKFKTMVSYACLSFHFHLANGHTFSVQQNRNSTFCTKFRFRSLCTGCGRSVRWSERHQNWWIRISRTWNGNPFYFPFIFHTRMILVLIIFNYLSMFCISARSPLLCAHTISQANPIDGGPWPRIAVRSVQCARYVNLLQLDKRCCRWKDDSQLMQRFVPWMQAQWEHSKWSLSPRVVCCATDRFAVQDVSLATVIRRIELFCGHSLWLISLRLCQSAEDEVQTCLVYRLFINHIVVSGLLRVGHAQSNKLDIFRTFCISCSSNWWMLAHHAHRRNTTLIA